MKRISFAKKPLVLIVLITLASFSRVYARQITVAKDGSGDYRTIQAAINAARSGDVIYVKPGIYEEHVDFKDGIVLQGAGRDNTTIRYGGDAPVITAKYIGSGKIDGFTIEYTGTGGHCSVWIVSSTIIISNNIITGAVLSGIEVKYASSNPLIENNIIRDNQSKGILIHYAANGTVRNNEIFNNSLHGIEVRECSNSLIESNIVRENRWDGIRVKDSTGII